MRRGRGRGGEKEVGETEGENESVPLVGGSWRGDGWAPPSPAEATRVGYPSAPSTAAIPSHPRPFTSWNLKLQCWEVGGGGCTACCSGSGHDWLEALGPVLGFGRGRAREWEELAVRCGPFGVNRALLVIRSSGYVFMNRRRRRRIGSEYGSFFAGTLPPRHTATKMRGGYICTSLLPVLADIRACSGVGGNWEVEKACYPSAPNTTEQPATGGEERRGEEKRPLEEHT